MKKNLIIYLTVIGLIGLFSACEKDETRTVMSGSPTVPTIQTIPDLTLTRATGTQTLTFVGTPVDPGFQASAIYYLEACPSGNNFANVTSILSSPQAAELKISVSDLNGILLKAFPADAVSTVDFRIRSVLVADAGTGIASLVYNSPTKPAQVTLYGLPRLNLIGSGIDQKIESALGDGSYSGFVKLNAANPFTLQDPDFGTIYGGAGDKLTAGGAAIVPSVNGWAKLNANTKDLTYKLIDYRIGFIGSATPGGWDAITPMEYNPQTGIWSLTLNLVAGAAKFRLGDSWDNGINLGLGDATHSEYTLSNLWNNGSSKDIPITESGNYTVKLTIGTTKYSATITKN